MTGLFLCLLQYEGRRSACPRTLKCRSLAMLHMQYFRIHNNSVLIHD
jgi:hypothetical protein